MFYLHTLYTHVVLILNLIVVQYILDVVLSFEKVRVVKIHSTSCLHHSIKNPSQQIFPMSSFPNDQLCG